MKYMGSKNRIAEGILSVILKDRYSGQWYVEPFCGGLGTFDKVTGNRIAADNNKYLIAMWKGLQEGRETPMHISKNLYSMAREEYNSGVNKAFDDFLIGWIGWMASFNGRFFDGGYSGTSGGRDYVDEQIRNTLKQIPSLEGAVFEYSHYADLSIPESSMVYCDIPYSGTKQYSTSTGFNHTLFWEWCRNLVDNGHKVFVSEYTAPKDFVCVWEKAIKSYMRPSRAESRVEKLFVNTKQLT